MMYRFETNAPQKTSRRKREREFFSDRRPGVYWFIAHFLLFRRVNRCRGRWSSRL